MYNCAEEIDVVQRIVLYNIYIGGPNLDSALKLMITLHIVFLSYNLKHLTCMLKNMNVSQHLFDLM